jgi:hypothetical protein
VSSRSIPLGDAWLVRRLSTRTEIVRVLLAAAILATALTAVLLARTSGNRSAPVLPTGSDGVVVLDLSASASATEYSRIHAYLTQLARSNGRFGLVLFSDHAYEALPPNTPAREFGTLRRYFQGPTYPTNPWASGFSLGTSISQGLDLARSIILGGDVRRRDVWLISDLSDAHADRTLLAKSVRSYLAAGISLHVLGVEAAPADVGYYRRLFGPQPQTVAVRPLSVEPSSSHSYAFPLGLAIAAALLAVALALNELLSAPLRWGPARASVPEPSS